MKLRLAAVLLALTTMAAAPRQIPAYALPTPTDVSPQLQILIAASLNPIYNQVPTTPAGWHQQVQQQGDKILATYPAMEKRLGVTVTQTTIGGVRCFSLTPNQITPENRNRLLVHIHGGAYVLYPGRAAIGEAILMAGIGHFRVISIDYRMPPDHPYPAAMDDADAVWRALVKTHNPATMAVFGTSTGGAMTLLLIQRALAEHLPLPAAVAPGTPWADLTQTGDTFATNQYVDNILVTYTGWLAAAAKLYANGHNLKDPLLSPIYGDFHHFPPAILTTGTRDLFLSNTVRVHRKLRQAGVEAQLQVFEAMSHAQYQLDDQVPETQEAFTEIASFFDHHLAN